MNTKRRVVITGMGAVSPVGHNLSETWAGILTGKVRAGAITRFDAREFPSHIAYQVSDDFVFDQTLVNEHERALITNFGAFGVQAASEALKQAGWPEQNAEARRTAVCIGVGMGSPDFTWYSDVYCGQKYDHPAIKTHMKYYPQVLSAIVGRMANAEGGVFTVHTACASSGQSLGDAYELIASGEHDVVLTGGADSMVNPFHVAGFCLLGALSTRNDDPTTASRPFDEGRNGFVLGEGACMLVFEEYEHAKRRGALILGEVVGYGVTESAYRITDLHPEGRGPIEAMRMAVEDAGIAPEQVGYVNAHGTSTLLNDRVEALAINQVFGAAAAVSSTKSVTGHLISAAGAMEFAFCVQALREQVLPPTVNVGTQDIDCRIRLTPKVATPIEMEYALSNSVGFGGSNTALIAKRYEA